MKAGTKEFKTWIDAYRWCQKNIVTKLGYMPQIYYDKAIRKHVIQKPVIKGKAKVKWGTSLNTKHK